jgi:hypothetical protein
MPGAAVNIGTGTTLTFTTSGFSAEIIETIDWTGITRGAAQTTHMTTTQATTGQIGGHTFIPTKFADPGQIALQVHFNPQTNPPLHQAPETIRITFPLVTGDATAAYWEGTGFMIEMGPSIPLEGVMVNRCVIKMSGIMVFTDAT